MTGTTRREAIETLEAGRAALDRLMEGLSSERAMRPATIGGGDWSARDLVGHIAFWDELALLTLGEWRAGRRPGVESIFAAGRDAVDAANASNQHRTAGQSLADVRARAGAAYSEIVQAIRDMTDEEWRSSPQYPDPTEATLGDLLGGVLGAPSRPFGHVFAHLPDLEAFVALPD